MATSRQYANALLGVRHAIKKKKKKKGRESVSRTDAGREFYVDGAAVLKARLPKDVSLNGVCSSGTDDEWSDCV